MVEPAQALEQTLPPGAPPALTLVTSGAQTAAVTSLAQLNQSASALLALTDRFNDLNHRVANERSVSFERDIVPLCVLRIDQRMQKESGSTSVMSRVGSNEKLMHAVYCQRYENNVVMPEWYSQIIDAVHLAGESRELPGPQAYIKASPTASLAHRAQLQEYDTTEAAIRELSSKPKEDPQGTRMQALTAKLDGLTQQFNSLIPQYNDIDPVRMAECLSKTKVQFILNPEHASALIKFSQSLHLALDSIAHGESPKLKLPVITLDEKSGMNETEVEIDLAQADPKKAFASLLETYVKVRKALLNAQHGYIAYSANDADYRPIIRDTSSQLTMALQGNGRKNSDLLAFICDSKEPEIREQGLQLFSQRVVEAAHNKQVGDLQSYGSIKQLCFVADMLITGNAAAIEIASAALVTSRCSGVQTGILKIRNAVDQKRYAELAKMLDDGITACSKGGFEYERTLVVIAGLTSLTAYPDAFSRVKSLLTTRDKISDVVNNAVREVGKVSSEGASLLEKMRGGINRSLLSKLSDYHGHKELVQTWHSNLSEHIELLQHPEEWLGMKPSEVFLNGWLLHGDPGMGKTFLVNCMANELGLPLVKITREDMEEAYTKVSNAGHEETSSALAKFIESKVKSAKDAMLASKSPAVMLFMDEMEAEFLKREYLNGDRKQLAFTNIMLRQIEAAMENNPQVIFVGATNHFDMVDSAAVRPGRFGWHLPINATSKEDAADLLQATLAANDLRLKAGEDNEKLLNAAEGLTPLMIKIATNKASIAARRASSETTEIDPQEIIARINVLKLLRKSVEEKKVED